MKISFTGAEIIDSINKKIAKDKVFLERVRKSEEEQKLRHEEREKAYLSKMKRYEHELRKYKQLPFFKRWFCEKPIYPIRSSYSSPFRMSEGISAALFNLSTHINLFDEFDTYILDIEEIERYGLLAYVNGC